MIREIREIRVQKEICVRIHNAYSNSSKRLRHRYLRVS